MSRQLRNKLATAREQVVEAYRNGATLREIADFHKVSPGTVRNMLIEEGASLRRPGRRGGAPVERPEPLPVDQLEGDE
jgi:transposase